MCGIVGYIGGKAALPILLDGLDKLEYRGYDSAGVSICGKSGLVTRKKKGRLSELKSALEGQEISGNLGIGHTRWATHGAPSDVNSHPHMNEAGTIALVHNGIIENYVRLKEWLGGRGYAFQSQTDTEVIVHLIDYYYKGNLLEAVQNALPHLSGSFALAIVCSEHPDELIAVRKDSSLVIGRGEGENYVASDIPALLRYTRDVYLLQDDEIARVTADGVEIMDQYGVPVERDIFHVSWDMKAAEKGGYPHFMLKEINEEPKALRDTLGARINDAGLLDMAEVGLTQDMAQKVRRIVIVACGTAYHAGVVGKYMMEKMLRIPVEVDIASEFRYRSPSLQPDDLFIVISQSGETADTLAALKLAHQSGASVLAITNVVDSTISREADRVMYTWAGPEIAVASTKAYTTQVMCMALLMMELGRMRGSIAPERYTQMLEALKKIPEQAAEILDEKAVMIINRAAHRHSGIDDAYFLGRNVDYATAMEASLKLKEISYIHSEVFAAGELKHGPIALIEDDTLVVVTATQENLYEKTASNIKEVKARGAHVLAVCPEEASLIQDIADEVIIIPKTEELFMPILSVMPMQLFAYYCSVERGYDVDKPRNLAKSVTVE